MDKAILKRALKLFLVFFRIGAFTFGGGYAMIPYIEREIVEKNKWIKSEDIVDIFAICQSVPGVIAVNSSTFVGYRVAGLAGSIAATIGVVLPSYIIISIIALFLYNFKDYPYVTEAFYGIQAGVTALMVHAVLRLGKTSVTNSFTFILAAGAFLALTLFGAPAIPVLIIAGILGLASMVYKNMRTQQENEGDK